MYKMHNTHNVCIKCIICIMHVYVNSMYTTIHIIHTEYNI